MVNQSLHQYNIPLFDAVVNYAKEKKISFHTPGHKHGDGIQKRFREFVGPKIFDIDLTLLEEVDSLHDPKGVIKSAQKLASQAFGADYTFFLVNGTSVGNQAMILATCNPGDKIIIPRNAHKSVYAGVILSGALPIYVQPEVNDEINVVCNVEPGIIEEKLEEYPDVKAVLITNPTYNGVCANLKEIERIVHGRKKILLVDEAHGPHFKFHEKLPLCAMDAGADIAVQSTHKILACVTQASMLHAKKGIVDILRLKRILQLLQTTSPSYILMSSLDVARMQMATEGRDLLEKVLELSLFARAKINQVPNLRCFGEEFVGRKGIYDLDVTKLTVDVCSLGITGYYMSKILNQNHKIQIEFADIKNLLAIVSIGNNKKDIEDFLFALKEISKHMMKELKWTLREDLKGTFPEFSSEVVLKPRDAVFAKTSKIPFKDSIGRISAEIVAPYPPGIPVLVPGERISLDAYHYLIKLKNSGAGINGQDDSSLNTIKVVEEDKILYNNIHVEISDKKEKFLVAVR